MTVLAFSKTNKSEIFVANTALYFFEESVFSTSTKAHIVNISIYNFTVIF